VPKGDPATRRTDVTRRLLLLIGATLAFWVLVALPARWAWGNVALTYSATAMALCLVPATVSLGWATWAYRQCADKQFTMIMGGTGLRLFAVAVGAFALYRSIAYFAEHDGFLTWVGVFYVVTLALETTFSLAGRPASDVLSESAAPPAARVG
jgi:hypothetical protein